MIYYTHAGTFHCDEVTGYAITLLAGFCFGFERLPDVKNIPTGGVVADIGREFNPTEFKFDHHQEFLTRRNGHPYATAGLLWSVMGETACKNVITNPKVDAKEVANRVDKTFIEGIDAHDSDNSYSVSATDTAGDVRIMTFPGIISLLNHSDPNDYERQRSQFIRAVAFAYEILKRKIIEAINFIETTHTFYHGLEVRESGQILILPKSMPWKEIVEEEFEKALFVISPSTHVESKYSLQSVTFTAKSRKPIIAIERPKFFSRFIHVGKWIAGSDDKEELVKLALYNMGLVDENGNFHD